MFCVYFIFFIYKKEEVEIKNRVSDLTITKMCFSGVYKKMCCVAEASTAYPAKRLYSENIAFQTDLNTSKGFRVTFKNKVNTGSNSLSA